jgi:UV DNA damage endonuclease
MSARSTLGEQEFHLGLCCQFVAEPIKFRKTTAAHLSRLKLADRRRSLSAICLHNAEALLQSVAYCARNGIACFRVNSQVLPCKTHPEVGYRVDELPDGELIAAAFRRAGARASEEGVRLAFHPDQFVVLNSLNDAVVSRSIGELAYQSEVAEWIGADVLNVHAGGAFGDKPAALARLARNLDRLPPQVRSRLTLENDDRVYAPQELLPLCRREGVPLVYDVHHHRCLPDGVSIEETTQQAQATWNRRPLFHISSPREGWDGPRPFLHHDYVDVNDFPDCWRGIDATIEVEAKAKELAVARLRTDLAGVVRRTLRKASPA